MLRPHDDRTDASLSDPRGTMGDMADTTATTLTEDEIDMLAMERLWWQYAGVKEQRIRERFGISATRYYQQLNALIDRPDALAHDPLLVRRLQRLRAERQRTRSARRLGIDA